MAALKKISLLTAIIFLCSAALVCRAEETGRLYVFYSPGCHKCQEAKARIIPAVEEKFKPKISIEYFDITDMENYKLLLRLKERYDPGLKITVPVFFLAGRLINSDNLTQSGVEDFVARALAAPLGKESELPEVDLISRFKALRLLTVTAVGLVDGVNPCAFTVIVFFISFLALQGYTKRELIAIGSCFILAVFTTYLFIGLGAFAFLYRLNKFWLVSKVLNYAVGLFSILIGMLALQDFFKFKKTQETEGLALQLPKAVKDQIHKIVGMHYRIDRKPGAINYPRPVISLALSALLTGFLISVLEAVCTGQTYLPTITFILKTTPLKLQAAAYLLVYNLMFVVPLFIIFVFALAGVSSLQFASFVKKHLLLIKALMAILFFGLGGFLLWRT